MGMPANEAQQLASLIPRAKVQGKMYTIPEALEQSSRSSRRAYDERSRRRASCSTSRRSSKGCTRHAGKHAAGVVISEGPLWDHVPCFMNGGA